MSTRCQQRVSTLPAHCQHIVSTLSAHCQRVRPQAMCVWGGEAERSRPWGWGCWHMHGVRVLWRRCKTNGRWCAAASSRVQLERLARNPGRRARPPLHVRGSRLARCARRRHRHRRRRAVTPVPRQGPGVPARHECVGVWVCVTTSAGAARAFASPFSATQVAPARAQGEATRSFVRVHGGCRLACVCHRHGRHTVGSRPHGQSRKGHGDPYHLGRAAVVAVLLYERDDLPLRPQQHGSVP